MTTNECSRGFGYESPTELDVTHTLAANHVQVLLRQRLNNISDQRDGSREYPPSRQHPADMGQLVNETEKVGAVSIKQRVACFQWTWYTSTMATGGIANVLASSTLYKAQ